MSHQKRRRSSMMDLDYGDESESTYSTSAQTETKTKSKETFVVLATVLLLLLIALITLVVLYFSETGLRHNLLLESERNLVILRACDRFELNEQHSLGLLQHGGDKGGDGMDSAVAVPRPTCPPCPKCHNYAQPSRKIRSERVDALRQEIDDTRRLAASKLNRKTRIEDALQRVSKDLLLLKFGSGNAVAAGGGGGNGGASSFVTEMTLKVPGHAELVPLSFDMFDAADVPYSLLHFFTQVSAGAWDGCSFTAHVGGGGGGGGGGSGANGGGGSGVKTFRGSSGGAGSGAGAVVPYSNKHILRAEAVGSNCNSRAFRDMPSAALPMLLSEYDSGTQGSGYIDEADLNALLSGSTSSVTARGTKTGGGTVVHQPKTVRSADIARRSVVNTKYPHNSPYCLNFSPTSKTPQFYIVLPGSGGTVSLGAGGGGLRGAPSEGSGEAVDYFQHPQFNGILKHNDVCIGRLQQGSIRNLELVLKLPLSKATSGGGGSASGRFAAGDSVTGGDAAVDDDLLKSAADSSYSRKFLLEKPATITRVRLK